MAEMSSDQIRSITIPGVWAVLFICIAAVIIATVKWG